MYFVSFHVYKFLFIFKDLLAREKKHEEELEVERKKRKEEEKVIIYLFLVVEVDLNTNILLYFKSVVFILFKSCVK